MNDCREERQYSFVDRNRFYRAGLPMGWKYWKLEKLEQEQLLRLKVLPNDDKFEVVEVISSSSGVRIFPEEDGSVSGIALMWILFWN